MQNRGQLKSVTVWLVLLGFLCALAVPSVVFAKAERQIATEGDPGDGMDFAGGWGGDDDSLTGEIAPAGIKVLGRTIFEIRVVPTIVDGKVVIRVEIISVESS